MTEEQGFVGCIAVGVLIVVVSAVVIGRTFGAAPDGRPSSRRTFWSASRSIDGRPRLSNEAFARLCVADRRPSVEAVKLVRDAISYAAMVDPERVYPDDDLQAGDMSVIMGFDMGIGDVWGDIEHKLRRRGIRFDRSHPCFMDSRTAEDVAAVVTRILESAAALQRGDCA